jgi:serine/threonine-protein kinase
MERTVVVKVVRNYLRSSKSELDRFEREAKTVARLNHPNIVALYDFGFIEDELPFIVMEYIRGMNLAQKVFRHGPPRSAVAIRIIKQICRGLEEAHRCGIIHRDLKPDNIILQDKFDRPDWVKLVDFGIAHMLDNKGKRLTRAGQIIGTPEYASPEQFKDLPLDTRSDIYSLGVVMFEMFTGRLPYEAGNLAALMTKILLEPAPSICLYRDDIEAGSPIDLLIQKCLEKDPEDRFQTVTEVRLAAETAYES